jgi:hypothetical protein
LYIFAGVAVLVHRVVGGSGLSARTRHNAVLTRLRADGLLGIRLLVVRRPLGHRRSALHGFYLQHLSDFLGSVLVYNPGEKKGNNVIQRYFVSLSLSLSFSLSLSLSLSASLSLALTVINT